MDEPFRKETGDFPARLLSHLQGRTGLIETPIKIGETIYSIARPSAADALIDEEEFARDERLPYWAELWPSSVALAGYLSKERLVGRRTIELGCGVGLPSVAALAGGARVTATDHYAAALDFVRYNAHHNLGVEPETRLLDWHAPGTEDLGGFDLVLASDVLYERRNVSALAALVPALLVPGGELLLSDPRRKNTQAFQERMWGKGFRSSTEECLVPSDGREVVVLVHRLRCF